MMLLKMFNLLQKIWVNYFPSCEGDQAVKITNEYDHLIKGENMIDIYRIFGY